MILLRRPPLHPFFAPGRPALLLLAGRSPVTLNGGNVSQWSDLSGNGRHASQGTGTAQPAYTASQFNGRPGVDFDGTTDFLNLTTTALNISRAVSGMTMFAVIHSDNVTQAKVLFWSSIGTGNSARAVLGTNLSGKVEVSGRREDTDAFAAVAGATTLTTGTRYVVAGRINYASALADVWINGVQDVASTAFQTAGPTSNTASVGVFVGANSTVPGAPYDGRLGAVPVYASALSDSQMRAVSRALGAMYGIGVS